MVGLTPYRLSPAQWSPQYMVVRPSEPSTRSHTAATAVRGRYLWQNPVRKCCRSRDVRTQRQPILDVNREKLDYFWSLTILAWYQWCRYEKRPPQTNTLVVLSIVIPKFQSGALKKNEHTFRRRQAKIVLYVFERPSNTYLVFLVKTGCGNIQRPQ